MKGKNPSLLFKCEETLRLQIAETLWLVYASLVTSLSAAEEPTALPTGHKWTNGTRFLPGRWQQPLTGMVSSGTTLWVTEIPSGFHPFLAPVGHGGSDLLLLPQTLWACRKM